MLLCDICRKDISKYCHRFSVYNPIKREYAILCETCYDYKQKLENRSAKIVWQLTKKKYGKETITK